MPSKSRSRSTKAKRGAPRKYSPCKGQEIRDRKTKRCRAKKLPGRPKMIRKSKSPQIDYERIDYEEYLMNLSDSGVVNMFGAAPYLQREFGLSKEDAEEVLLRWMNSFSETKEKSKSISPGLIQRRIEHEKKMLSIYEQNKLQYRLEKIKEAMAEEYQKRWEYFWKNGKKGDPLPLESEEEKALELEYKNVRDQLYIK